MTAKISGLMTLNNDTQPLPSLQNTTQSTVSNL